MHDPENQIKLQPDASNKTIKTMVFQRKIGLLYPKIDPNRNKLYHKKQKNVRGNSGIEILAKLNIKKRSQNVYIYSS